MKKELEEIKKRVFRIEMILYVVLAGGVFDISTTKLLPVVAAMIN